MLKRIWKYLTGYGVDSETFSEIEHSIAEGNCRNVRFFLAACTLGLLLGLPSPLLLDKDPLKALIFLLSTLPFAGMYLLATRLSKRGAVTMKQMEPVVLCSMLMLVAEQIYIGVISNPLRVAVLFHAFLLCMMAFFAIRPIIAIGVPLGALAALIFADSLCKSPELMYLDMVVGCFSTTCAIAAGLCFTGLTVRRLVLENQNNTQRRQLEQKSRIALEALQSMERSGEALSVVRHDYLHHLRALALLCREKPDEAADYADSLITELAAIQQTRFTKNPMINAILTVQAQKAQACGVRFHAEASLPERLSVPDNDLCTVLMNLTGNAVEAAAGAPPESQRRVSVRLYIEDGFLLAELKNSVPAGFDQNSLRAALQGRSSKQDGQEHGIGLKSAAAVLSAYDGELRYTLEGDILTLNTGMWLGSEERV